MEIKVIGIQRPHAEREKSTHVKNSPEPITRSTITSLGQQSGIGKSQQLEVGEEGEVWRRVASLFMRSLLSAGSPKKTR